MCVLLAILCAGCPHTIGKLGDAGPSAVADYARVAAVRLPFHTPCTA
jgi:hypothetical protein